MSKLTVDENGRIVFGELIEDGSRKITSVFVCYNFFRQMNLTFFFITNERIEGIVVVMKIITKNKIELPWLLEIFSCSQLYEIRGCRL